MVPSRIISALIFSDNFAMAQKKTHEKNMEHLQSLLIKTRVNFRALKFSKIIATLCQLSYYKFMHTLRRCFVKKDTFYITFCILVSFHHLAILKSTYVYLWHKLNKRDLI